MKTSTDKAIRSLDKLIRSRTPVIYVVTREEGSSPERHHPLRRTASDQPGRDRDHAIPAGVALDLHQWSRPTDNGSRCRGRGSPRQTHGARFSVRTP